MSKTKDAQELVSPIVSSQGWQIMWGTPLHKNVVCEECGITPKERPGPGWRQNGRNSATWRHRCWYCPPDEEAGE